MEIKINKSVSIDTDQLQALITKPTLINGFRVSVTETIIQGELNHEPTRGAIYVVKAQSLLKTGAIKEETVELSKHTLEVHAKGERTVSGTIDKSYFNSLTYFLKSDK